MTTTPASTTPASTTTSDTTPARRGRKGLAAVGLGLALATTAPVLAGPLTGVARADTVADPAHQVLTQDDHGSHLHGRVRTTDGTPLRLASVHLDGTTHAENGGAALPQRIAAGGNAHFEYSSDWFSGAEMTFIYAIGDGTWELWAHTSVPLSGKNIVDGEIRRYGASQADPNSPYNVTAEFSSTSTYNPEPSWTITRKPAEVVTDRVEQANLLNTLCKDGNGACRYVPKTFTPDVEGTTVDVAPPFYNNTHKDAEYTYTKGVTTSWEHKVGIEGKAEFEVGKVVSLGVKVSYEFTYGIEYHDSQEMKASVEPGHGVVFRYTPVMAKVSGDFSIFAEGTRYDLKDVDFSFPTGKGVYRAVELPPLNGPAGA